MHAQKEGFTLLELIIVAVIISIIMSIAIPSIIQARRTANEASAIQSMRTIATSEAMFQSNTARPAPTTGVGLYADLDDLGAAFPPFIDDALASGVKQGYSFTVALIDDPNVPTYAATGGPVFFQRTGNRSFYVDQSGVVRFSLTGAPATSSDTSLN